ncbi:uncharacterized protein [Nerophis lumbriciformis]|uniref:uncharacterized protein n=1 Tax=Nerophis lumbriciformis TaxID=546530 RepID=UPI002AE09661|nr:mucin-2-like [Nerophis lumbriciformis]
MSTDDFQTKYASFMEHIVKSTVEETTKLFETMVDDLKAELSRAKMENEALKTTCRENETVNTPSVNESSQSEGPERRDTAVQCDLLPSHASLDQNPQRAHEEMVYNLLKDHDYDASFKDIFYQSQPEMLNVSPPTDTSNELFLALTDSSPESSSETDTEDYQIDQHTDTEDYQIDQQTDTEDIDRQCSYGMCRKNKCLVTAVQAGLKRDRDVHKPPTILANSPATTGIKTRAKSNAEQMLGRKGYANPTTFQEQLAAPKVQIQLQSFGKTPANKQARVVVQQYSGVPHPEEQQVEPRLPEKQMQGKEQQVEPRLLGKQMQGKEQQVEPRLPEKQMQGKEQQVESTLLKKQMEQKEQQVESTLLKKLMERKEQQKEPTLREKQMERQEQQKEPTLPEKQMQGKEQQVESTLLKKQMQGKEQQVESTLLKEQQKEPTLREKQIERKEQQVQSTLLGKQPEGKKQQVEPTVLEKEPEGKEQRIKQTLPEKELEQTEQQVESTLLEKQTERKEQQVESTLLEKPLDVGGDKCSLTEEEQQVPEKELAGKEHQVEPTVLEKELVGKEQQIKQTLPEKELEGTELQVEQTLLEKPLKEVPNKCGSTEEKANVEINVTVNRNRRQRKQPSDKVKRLLQTPKQIAVSASNNGEEHNGVDHVPTIFERYTSLCEVAKVSPRSCTTECTTKASPAKSSFPPEIISVQGNASSKKTRANRPHQDTSAHKKTDSPRKSLIRKSGRSKKFYGITQVCLRSSTAKDTTTSSPLKTTDPPGRKKRVSTRENSASKKTQTISPLQDRSENAETESSGKRSTRNSANSNKSHGVPEVSLRSSTTKDSATTSPLKTKSSPEIISTQENASSIKIQTVSPHQDGSCRKNTESSDKGLGQDGAGSEKSLCVPEVCLRSSTIKDTTSTPESTVPPESISAEEDAGSQLTQTISPHQDLSAHKKTKLSKNSATSNTKLSTTKDTTKTSPAKTALPSESMSTKENASLKKTQTNSPQQDRSSHKEAESLGTRLSTFSASSKSHGVPEVGLILNTTKETTATSPPKSPIPPEIISTEETASSKKTQPNSPQQERSAHKRTDSSVVRLTKISASSKKFTSASEVFLRSSTTKDTTTTSPPKSALPPEVISIQENASSKKTETNKETGSLGTRLSRDSASSNKAHEAPEVFLRSSTTKDTTTTSPLKSTLPPEIISTQEKAGSKKDRSGNKKTESSGTKLAKDSASSKKSHGVPKVCERLSSTKDTTTFSPPKSDLPPEVISIQENASSKKTETNALQQDMSGHKETDSLGTRLSRDSASSKKAHEAPEMFLRSSTTKDTTTTSPLKSTLPPEIISTQEKAGSKKDRSGNKKTESSAKDSASSKKSLGVPKVCERLSSTKDTTTSSPPKSDLPPEVISIQETASSKKTEANSLQQDMSGHKETDSLGTRLSRDSASSKKAHEAPEMFLRSSTTKDTTTTSPLKSTLPPEIISTQEKAGSKKDRSGNKKTESNGTKLAKDSASSKKSHGVPKVCERLSSTKDTTTFSPPKSDLPPEVISIQENASSKKTETNSLQQDMSGHKETDSLGTRLSRDSASSNKAHEAPEMFLRSSTTKDTTTTSPLKSTLPPEIISTQEKAGSKKDRSGNKKTETSGTKLAKDSASSKKSLGVPKVCERLSSTKDTTTTSPPKSDLPPEVISIQETASSKKTEANSLQQDLSGHKETDSLGTRLSRDCASSKKAHEAPEMFLRSSTTKDTTTTSPLKSTLPPEIISTPKNTGSKKDRSGNKKTESSWTKLAKDSASSKKSHVVPKVCERFSSTKDTNTTSPPKNDLPPEVISIQENASSKKTETNVLQQDMSGHKETDSLGTRLSRDSASSKKAHEAPEVFLRSSKTKNTTTTSPLQSTLPTEIISTPKNTGSKKTRTNSPHQDRPGNKKAESSGTKLSKDSGTSKKSHGVPKVCVRFSSTKAATTTSPQKSALPSGSRKRRISTQENAGSKKTLKDSPNQDSSGNKKTESSGTKLAKDSSTSCKSSHEVPKGCQSPSTTKDTTTSLLKSIFPPRSRRGRIVTRDNTGSKKSDAHQNRSALKKTKSSGSKLPKSVSFESPLPSVSQKASSFIENDAGLKESCSEEEPTSKRLKRPYSSLLGTSTLSSPQWKKLPKKATALSKARETIAKKPRLDEHYSISEQVKIRNAQKSAKGSDPSKLRKTMHDSSDETGKKSTSPSVPARKATALRAKRSSSSPVQKEARSPRSQSLEAPSPMSPAVGSPPHSLSPHDVNTPPAQPSIVIGKPLLKNQCGQCGRVLSSPAALESHLNLHIGRRPFSCRICRKDFPDARGLRRHTWVHADSRIHVCQQCGKGFVYSYGLTKHLQMVHRKIKPFVCQICDKAFFTKGDVEDHIRIHTGEKPFQCHVCGKRFVKKIELRAHLKWHSGEKRHWCPYCGKGFFDYNNLKRHKYIHTGEKPKSCPHCPKHFKQSSHLKKHIRTIHKNV